MRSQTRRHFIKSTAATSAAIPLSTWARTEGANSDIRIGVIGHRGKGSSHIKSFDQGCSGARVVALCDADQSIMDRDKERFFTANNKKVKLYNDLRALLDDDDIDAIVTATPNHWHSLVGIWACQAGKHAYVEKPISHNIQEGRKLVEAARKYNKVVQTGTQGRSDRGNISAINFIQDGGLGKVQWSRGLCYKRRDTIGKVAAPTPIPDSVNFDLWSGPAPKKPLMRQRLHYDWHWVWDTGNGDLGNQGIHQMDVARWALGEDLLAPSVISLGGRFGYDDDGETANTQIIYLDYPDAPLIFEVKGLPLQKDMKAMPNFRGVRVGNVVQCEKGYWAGGKIYDNEGNTLQIQQIDGGGSHAQNFIDAVRSGNNEDLNADCLKGHISSALCHMGNISYRLGKTHAAGEIRERMQEHKEFNDSFTRMQAHLAANEVDLEKTPPTLGPWLKLDPKSERFVGPFAEEANQLVTRNYRAPFVVPDQV